MEVQQQAPDRAGDSSQAIHDRRSLPGRLRGVKNSWGGGGLASRLRLSDFSGLYVLLVLIVVFSIVLPDTFPTITNLKVVASDAAIVALVTIGLTVALATDAFDISVGAIMSWAIVLVAWLLSAHGLNPMWAILLTVVSGAVIGAINGLIVVKLQVTPIIATMGTSAVMTALAFWLAGGQSIVTGIPTSFKNVARIEVFGVPITVIYLVVIAAALWYLMEHTPRGRFMYATGGNETAARLAGIRVGQMQVVAFVISGSVAAIAGVLLTAKVGSSGIGTGAPYLLPAFAGAFLGSTQIKRGRFNILGSLLAVYLLATGVKGLQLIWPAAAWVKDLFTGLTLIIAVAIAARAALAGKGVKHNKVQESV
jgi:ribose transport system permease protein